MKDFFKKIFKYFFTITITVLLIGITTDSPLLGMIILICGIVVLCFCAVIDLLLLYDKKRKPTLEELEGRIEVEELLRTGRLLKKAQEKINKKRK